MTREGQLSALLTDLFAADPSKMRLWVSTDLALAELLPHISWNGAASQVAFDIVERANARGLWGVLVFEGLVERRPNLEDRIRSVARLFHVGGLIPDPAIASRVESFIQTAPVGFPRTPANLRLMAQAADVPLGGASFLPFPRIFRTANARDLSPENVGRMADLLRTAATITSSDLTDKKQPLARALNSLKHRADYAPPTAVLVDSGSQSGQGGPPQEVVEALVVAEAGDLPFGYLEGGFLAGRSVARLHIPRSDGGAGVGGTGWLITPDLLVTNHHVINARRAEEADATPQELADQVAGMAVEFDVDGPPKPGQVATPAVGATELLCWNRRRRVGDSGLQGLDFAIVRLAQPQDQAVRPIAELRHAPGLPRDMAINIIQHPQGQPKRVALRANRLKQQGEDGLRYTTNTDAGSSGSPLYDDGWNVVGLHRASVPANVFVHGTIRDELNVGTPLSLLVQALQTPGALDGGDGAAVWAEIDAFHNPPPPPVVGGPTT